MPYLNLFVAPAILILLLNVFVVKAAFGQMTIFNIPTAETLEKSSTYFEGDFITKPAAYRNGGYQTYGYRVVYGLGHNTEIGSNFYYTRDGGPATGDIQFVVKHAFYQNERAGLVVSGGALLSVPLRDRRGSRTFGMVFANVSKNIERANGLRVTGGVYSIFGGGQDFGTKSGVMAGVEQPIYKKISFIADWYSGNNRFGYVAAGLNYQISKRQFVLAGYNFGNSGRGNNAFSTFYGYTF